MSSSLGRVWFSSTMARLARLSWPQGAETRRRPYIVCARDGYKVGSCEGKVLIALVLVLAVMPLAVIRAVIYAYSK